MSCDNVQNPSGFALCRVAKSKTRRVSRYVVCGNVKPVKFCMYPCRGVLHTPQNVPRQRFGSKIEQVLGVSLLERVKPGAFLAHSGAGIWNLPNFARARVGRKSIRLEMSCAKDLGLKSGGFLTYPYWENVKPDRFFTYPCRGVLHTPRNAPRRRFGCKTGRVFGVSLLGRVKSGAFLVYPCAEI